MPVIVGSVFLMMMMDAGRLTTAVAFEVALPERAASVSRRLLRPLVCCDICGHRHVGLVGGSQDQQAAFTQVVALLLQLVNIVLRLLVTCSGPGERSNLPCCGVHGENRSSVDLGEAAAVAESEVALHGRALVPGGCSTLIVWPTSPATGT